MTGRAAAAVTTPGVTTPGVTTPGAATPGASPPYALLAGMIVLLWLAVLPIRPLFNTDEGRYAEIPREMLSDGDWVIPHLNGVAYIEKPPLQYWGTAIAYRLFGESAFSARLCTALAAFGGIAAVWWAGRRLWDAPTGWRAAAILCGMLLYAGLGQMLTLDMGLTACMTVSLVCFLSAQRCAEQAPGSAARGSAGSGSAVPGSAAPGSARTLMWLAWLAAALGVLTKGLVAAAIPAAVLMVYSVLARDTAPWRRLHWAGGLLLFLVVTVPWHWLAARRLPDFLDFFFIHEHFARYLTPAADREEAWWFFGAVFCAGSLPWILPALRVVAGGWRRRAPPGRFDVTRFLWVWTVFVVLFFSASDSKLIPYVLPAMPALALSIAALPAAEFGKDVQRTALLTAVFAAAAIVAGVNAHRLVTPSDRSIYVLQMARPLLEIGAVLGVSGAFVLARGARQATLCTAVIGSGWCLALLILMRGAAVLAPMYSGAGLAAAIPQAERAEPLYSVGTYDQTLPFYLRRTVALFGYTGELEYGLRHSRAEPGPARRVRDLDEFLRQWRAQSHAFAVMEISMFDRLKARGVPMRELHRNVHRILVSRS